MKSSKVKSELIDWLKTFEDCVRKVDYERAKPMFYPDAYCFGSVAELVQSLDSLVKKQWSKIWPNSKEFAFDIDQLCCHVDDQEKMACLILPWTSKGFHKDGSSFRRPGRVTVVLLKDVESGAWRAIHTHYSLTPGTPKNTFLSIKLGLRGEKTSQENP